MKIQKSPSSLPLGTQGKKENSAVLNDTVLFFLKKEKEMNF